jgi:hypothetical protein
MVFVAMVLDYVRNTIHHLVVGDANIFVLHNVML